MCCSKYKIKEVIKMSNEEKSFPKTSINWEITTYGKLLYKKKIGEKMFRKQLIKQRKY